MNLIAKGGYQYPTTIDAALSEMEKFKPTKLYYQMNKQLGQSGQRTGHAFVTTGKAGATVATETDDGNNKQGYQCWNCDRWNDCKKYNCPHTTKEDSTPTRKAKQQEQTNGGVNMVNDRVISEKIQQAGRKILRPIIMLSDWALISLESQNQNK